MSCLRCKIYISCTYAHSSLTILQKASLRHSHASGNTYVKLDSYTFLEFCPVGITVTFPDNHFKTNICCTERLATKNSSAVPIGSLLSSPTDVPFWQGFLYFELCFISPSLLTGSLMPCSCCLTSLKVLKLLLVAQGDGVGMSNNSINSKPSSCSPTNTSPFNTYA